MTQAPGNTAAPDRDRQLYNELKGDKCVCGNLKKPFKTFCGACYFALPRDMRNALYSQIGQGYAQAYDAALRRLGRA